MRKRVGAGYVAAFLLPVLAIALVATRILGAQSRWIGIAVYGLGWVAMILAIRSHPRARGLAERGTSAVRTWLVQYWRLAIGGVALAVGGAALLVLVPVDRVEFAREDPQVTRDRVEADFDQVLLTVDGMTRLLDAHIGKFADDHVVSDAAAKSELLGVWASYVDYAMSLDQLVARHQYFYQIDPIHHADMNGLSFLVGYASLVAQLEQAARLVDAVTSREVETLLDERREALGIPPRTFHHLKAQLTRPDTLLRLHAGRAHLSLVERAGALPSPPERALVDRVKRAYAEVASRTQKPDLAIDNPLDVLEHTAHEAFYPVQKGISKAMANIRLTGRENFVSEGDLTRAHGELRPGDILLERRNWYLTNVGLPGFWPHAALYTGTLRELDAHFRPDARRATGGKAPSAFLRERFPALVKDYETPDPDGHEKRVIEAMGQGVVLTSLEHSGHADYLAALRPRLEPEATLAALVRAFSHHKKPYDFDFDFVTDEKIVCSELVYKAYRAPGADAGLDFDLTPAAGRQVLSPNDIAKKFALEKGDDRELDFVLFLDGSESSKKAARRDAKALRQSYRRPKWDHLQQ